MNDVSMLRLEQNVTENVVQNIASVAALYHSVYIYVQTCLSYLLLI